MKRIEEKKKRWFRRKLHIRKTVHGSAERPRMTVFKSNRYLYIQVVDDESGRTLVSASNLEKENRSLKSTVADASKLGAIVGKKMKEKKINTVVFDRNGYKYHGVVKAIADGARESGITI